MTSITTNYGLILYNDDTDVSASFIDFRMDLAGDTASGGSGSSNMVKIDEILGDLSGSIITLQTSGSILNNEVETGWIFDSDIWVYVSATQFKITGKDVTARFPVGTKIKLTQTTVKYFYVTAAAFSTDTTVTVTGGSLYSLVNATIANPYYSYVETPQGYPFAENVKIRVERSTNQSIPNTVWTAQSFDTIVYEGKPSVATSQWVSGSPTRLTCLLPGLYLIIAHTRFAANATGIRGIDLAKNGVLLSANTFQTQTSVDVHIQTSDINQLVVNDYIESFVYQTSGSALNTISSSNNIYFEWVRLGQ